MDSIESSYNFIAWGISVTLIVGALVLAALSVKNRDIAFIKDHPLMFLLELLFISIIPGIGMFIISFTREATIKTSFFAFMALSAKLAVVHILLQLSGFYSGFYRKI